MANLVSTLQSNIKNHNKDITQYSNLLGGINVKNKVLEQYDPFKGGFARIIFTQMPKFMEVTQADDTAKFKHILSYGNTKIGGIGDKSMDFESISGGYSGASFEIPSVLKDSTNSISITVYELSGSPWRDYLNQWLCGISDPITGLCTYNGAMEIDPTIEPLQSNHSAEAFYIVTDVTGLNIEYACQMTNLVPKQVPMSHLNYDAGSHNIAQIDIDFSVNKYESFDINEKAKQLLSKYSIQRSYIDFQSGYTTEDIAALKDSDIIDWA